MPFTLGSILGRLRAGILFYLIGLITTLQLTYLSERYFPLDASYGLKAVLTLLVLPLVFVGVGFWLRGTRRAAFRRAGLDLDEGAERARLGFWKRFDWLVLAVAMFTIWSAGYFLTAAMTRGERTHSLLLELDHLAPFEPAWVWLYFALYPMFLLPLVLPYPKRLATTVMVSYITLMVVIYTVFLVFPVSYPRPDLVVTDFSTWALSLVYAGDTPANCFPSSHCAMSLMAALVLLEVRRGLGAWALFGALAVGVSTLFVKQHYVLDVASAWSLTLVVYFAFFKGRIIDVVDDARRDVSHRVEAAIEGRLEEVVRRVVREELERALKGRE